MRALCRLHTRMTLCGQVRPVFVHSRRVTACTSSASPRVLWAVCGVTCEGLCCSLGLSQKGNKGEAATAGSLVRMASGVIESAEFESRHVEDCHCSQRKRSTCTRRASTDSGLSRSALALHLVKLNRNVQGNKSKWLRTGGLGDQVQIRPLPLGTLSPPT